nr:7,8-didemethyl-8-hydroxy-5-deazariboflavin synthase subunit CofG [Petrachloros mirabilis]
MVTYSPALTLVPTYECFNRCTYCNFRQDPGQDTWLGLDAAATQLAAVQAQGSHEEPGVVEILLLSGEVHPQSPRRQAWVQHLYDLAALALRLGFLPHTNAGPLSLEEWKFLKAVNVSMGLMLEQVTPKLLEQVHRHAPSKVPRLRLQQMHWAGELGIPFTTGLLLGLGETELDWRDTLMAIAQSHQQWGHIQEVIVQPYQPGHQDRLQGQSVTPEQMIGAVSLARDILPQDITIQIPPNLMSPELLLACLEAGARDLGGIGPRDHVNPDYPFQRLWVLQDLLRQVGWQLQPRLPVYARFVPGLPRHLQEAIGRWQVSLTSA